MLQKSLLPPPPLRNPILLQPSFSSSPPLPLILLLLPRSFHHHSPPPEPYDPPFSARRPAAPKPPSDGNCSRGRQLPAHSDLPFDFRYSYSETNPSVKPIAFREPPKFSPFGPGRLDRRWDGVSAPVEGEGVDWRRVEEERKAVIGEPLTDEEVLGLVEKYRHSYCSRQINLGKGGVTHNMIDDIHNHWKRAEAVRIKCLGVPTLDIDNVCFHLEDKTGGVIIYRNVNILILYRGQHYDPKQRPAVPLMLWKPRAPIYPRLVKNVAEGLTFEETKEMRNKGLNSSALMKLSMFSETIFICYTLCLLEKTYELTDTLNLSTARNGVFVNVVERVQVALETEEVVRLDCKSMDNSDCKKIGVKLRDLVPCVPLLFKDSQIILWSGKKIHETSD